MKAKTQVGVGRMDADGAPDSVFKRKKNLVLYKGNGPGGLTSGGTKVRGRLRGFDWVIGISDIDLTGHADVLLRKKSDGGLYLLPGNERRFGKPVLIGKRHERLRPGGLGREQAGRRPLGGVRRVEAGPSLGSVRMHHQDGGAAPRERLHEGGQTGRGSRTDL